MTTLYCDICGASYPDTEEQCPICGSARALASETPYSDHVPKVGKKVRGGRYSKRNVKKRLNHPEQAEQETAAEVGSVPVHEPEPVAVHEPEPVTVHEPEPVSEPVAVPEPVRQEPKKSAEVPAKMPALTREEQEEKKARRRCRWLNFLLIVSVMVFLASVAFIVGHYALPYAQAMGWLPEALTDYIPQTPGSPFPWQ